MLRKKYFLYFIKLSICFTLIFNFFNFKNILSLAYANKKHIKVKKKHKKKLRKNMKKTRHKHKKRTKKIRTLKKPKKVISHKKIVNKHKLLHKKAKPIKVKKALKTSNQKQKKLIKKNQLPPIVPYRPIIPIKTKVITVKDRNKLTQEKLANTLDYLDLIEPKVELSHIEKGTVLFLAYKMVQKIFPFYNNGEEFKFSTAIDLYKIFLKIAKRLFLRKTDGDELLKITPILTPQEENDLSRFKPILDKSNNYKQQIEETIFKKHNFHWIPAKVSSSVTAIKHNKRKIKDKEQIMEKSLADQYLAQFIATYIYGGEPQTNFKEGVFNLDFIKNSEENEKLLSEFCKEYKINIKDKDKKIYADEFFALPFFEMVATKYYGDKTSSPIELEYLKKMQNYMTGSMCELFKFLKCSKIEDVNNCDLKGCNKELEGLLSIYNYYEKSKDKKDFTFKDLEKFYTLFEKDIDDEEFKNAFEFLNNNYFKIYEYYVKIILQFFYLKQPDTENLNCLTPLYYKIRQILAIYSEIYKTLESEQFLTLEIGRENQYINMLQKIYDLLGKENSKEIIKAMYYSDVFLAIQIYFAFCIEDVEQFQKDFNINLKIFPKFDGNEDLLFDSQYFGCKFLYGGEIEFTPSLRYTSEKRRKELLSEFLVIEEMGDWQKLKNFDCSLKSKFLNDDLVFDFTKLFKNAVTVFPKINEINKYKLEEEKILFSYLKSSFPDFDENNFSYNDKYLDLKEHYVVPYDDLVSLSEKNPSDLKEDKLILSLDDKNNKYALNYLYQHANRNDYKKYEKYKSKVKNNNKIPNYKQDYTFSYFVSEIMFYIENCTKKFESEFAVDFGKLSGYNNNSQNKIYGSYEDCNKSISKLIERYQDGLMKKLEYYDEGEEFKKIIKNIDYDDLFKSSEEFKLLDSLKQILEDEILKEYKKGLDFYVSKYKDYFKNLKRLQFLILLYNKITSNENDVKIKEKNTKKEDFEKYVEEIKSCFLIEEKQKEVFNKQRKDYFKSEFLRIKDVLEIIFNNYLILERKKNYYMSYATLPEFNILCFPHDDNNKNKINAILSRAIIQQKLNNAIIEKLSKIKIRQKLNAFEKHISSDFDNNKFPDSVLEVRNRYEDELTEIIEKMLNLFQESYKDNDNFLKLEDGTGDYYKIDELTPSYEDYVKKVESALKNLIKTYSWSTASDEDIEREIFKPIKEITFLKEPNNSTQICDPYEGALEDFKSKKTDILNIISKSKDLANFNKLYDAISKLNVEIYEKFLDAYKCLKYMNHLGLFWKNRSDFFLAETKKKRDNFVVNFLSFREMVKKSVGESNENDIDLQLLAKEE